MRQYVVRGILLISVFVGFMPVTNEDSPIYLTADDTSATQLVQDENITTKRFKQPDIASIRSELHAIAKRNEDVSMSLHFEYLPTNQTIDINPAQSYEFMSLAKLPIILLTFQQIEAGLISLDSTVPLESTDMDARYGTAWVKGIGSPMSVREAIRATIEDSDNTAFRMLRRTLIEKAPQLHTGNNGLDVKQLLYVHKDGKSTDVNSYSEMIRCIYTACKFSEESSLTILRYMSQTKESAIREGSTAETTVANKFGINDEKGQMYMYHDCGIGYTENGNYILCIMTQHPSKSTRHLVVELASTINKGIVYAN